MTVWVIRGGRYGEREEEALENNVLTVGFGYAENLDGAQTREDVAKEIQGFNPAATPSQIAAWTRQIWSFKTRIENGDLVVMPRKGQPYIAIGAIAGDYIFRPELQELRHGRPVEWINTEVSRNSLSGRPKAFPVGRHDRISATGSRRRKSSGKLSQRPMELHLAVTHIQSTWPMNPRRSTLPSILKKRLTTEYGSTSAVNSTDMGLLALLLRYLRRWVMWVEVAPPGPDGGVDIVAGSGPMGFDRPRICVQVKSGNANHQGQRSTRT